MTMDLSQAYTFILPSFTLVAILFSPAQYIVNAPFGRFTPSSNPNSPLLVNGIYSWIAMELISPLTFLYAYYHAPLNLLPSPAFTPHLDLSVPGSAYACLLSGAFVVHYLNRALISPLRAPSRSKSHLIVPASATLFNLINGFLMGTYLSSPACRAFLTHHVTENPGRFWGGLGLTVLGFVGNVYHDEILYDLRRKAMSKGKGKADEDKGEHYSIPHGALYTYISYPNYFCEWIEWLGFALASAPFPLLSLSSPSLLSSQLGLHQSLLAKIGQTPFLNTITPPWTFLILEVLLMSPRAVRGHQWYKNKFGSRYPEERKAVVPFLI